MPMGFDHFEHQPLQIAGEGFNVIEINRSRLQFVCLWRVLHSSNGCFEMVGRKSSAIQRNKRGYPLKTCLMDVSGQRFATGPCFADEDYGKSRLAGQLQLAEQTLHAGTFADQHSCITPVDQ